MESGIAWQTKKLLISSRILVISLNKTQGGDFKVSSVCSAIFDNNLSTDTFGRGGSGKEGAGWDNMTAVIVMFKPQDDSMEVDTDGTKKIA
jgi:hypothetical protein